VPLHLHSDPQLQQLLDEMPREGWERNYYAKLVTRHSTQLYADRVDMVQFVGEKKVLDVGCGFGQWAIELARRNRSVVGVDPNPLLIKAAKRLAELHEMENLAFCVDALPNLGFPDESFDLIWCWSVLMFVNRPAVLREFHRLLRPGGRFLAGAVNARGRWLYKTLQSLNPLNPRLFRLRRLRQCWATFRSGSDVEAVPNFTMRGASRALCETFGFELVAVDFDGHIDFTGENRRMPVFKPRFCFMENNIEFIGRKVRPADTTAAAAGASLHGTPENTSS